MKRILDWFFDLLLKAEWEAIHADESEHAPNDKEVMWWERRK